jgi:hypothetical protein
MSVMMRQIMTQSDECQLTLTAASGVEAAVLGVRGFEPKWCPEEDSNLHDLAIAST